MVVEQGNTIFRMEIQKQAKQNKYSNVQFLPVALWIRGLHRLVCVISSFSVKNNLKVVFLFHPIILFDFIIYYEISKILGQYFSTLFFLPLCRKL